MHKYQKEDAERCILLYELWADEFAETTDIHEDYRNEIDLIFTSIRMEERGILVDESQCRKLIKWMEVQLEDIRDKTREIFGEYINWNADDQVRRVLYRRLGLPVIAYAEKSKKPSTEKDVLLMLREKYPHLVFDLILRQRSYTKGLAMVRSYLELRHLDGRVRTNKKTNQARTGRQASERPNLQNVSKDAALKNPFPVSARKCFRATPGYYLLFVDYSGIEMRLIIDASQEEEAIEILKNGGDIHAFASEIIFGSKWRHASEKEKSILRSGVKNATFGIAYGAGLAKFALTLGMSVVDAKPGFDRYKNRFPKIANFNKTVANVIKEQGYITTAFGRKLEVPITEAYIGTNYLIQGNAAGVLKRAENRVDKYCMEYWPDLLYPLMSVHDELILEKSRKIMSERNRICRDISTIMTYMPQISAPLEVEWKRSLYTWNDAKKFEVA
jgi:DNA polymerase-1